MTTSFIRSLRRDDLPAVGCLVEATNLFPAAMLPEMTSAYFAGQLDQHRWLVFDDGSVSGVTYHVPEPLTDGTWNLLLIAVDPGRHGQGIGSALMRHVEAELRDQAQRILLVETSGSTSFERTRAFYDMLGYAREARIRDYYSRGDDKIVFRKALD